MRKPVPNYWWDFQGNNIIVESDYDKYKCVAVFPFIDDGPGCAAAAINQAQAHIIELNAGRISPVSLPMPK